MSDEISEQPELAAKPAGKTTQTKQAEHQAKVQALIVSLKDADPSKFLEVFDRHIKRRPEEIASTKDLRHFLGAALECAPADLSGAAIIKHFKEGKDWKPVEVVAALDELLRVLVARKADMEELGSFIRGALIPLVGAQVKFDKPPSHVSERDDFILALLKVHREVFSHTRVPFSCSPENPTRNLLNDVEALFVKYCQRPDVAALKGERLFGFDRVFVLDSEALERTQKVCTTSAAPAESDPIASEVSVVTTVTKGAETGVVQPELNPGATAVDAKGASAQKIRERLESCTRELETAQQRLEDSKEKQRQLREELAAVRANCVSIERQLKEAQQIREMQAERLKELDEALEAAQEETAQLVQTRRELAERQDKITELTMEIKHVESQNASAKNMEFARGRAVEKADISAYCLVLLRVIQDEAERIDGDAGKVIASEAKSLVDHLS
jgi:hypothetical protein